MSINLQELYPELKNKDQHFFNEEEFQLMPYFKEVSQLMPQLPLGPFIKKTNKHFRLISVNKGTVIYFSGMPSTSAYFLCHGQVNLLIKKNNRQKLQNYPKHILHQLQQRINYLNSQFGIPSNLCELFMNEFYEEKVMFKMLPYQKIYGQGYFGFGDLIKGSNRTFTAITTQDSILLELQKPKFEVTLKEVQIKKEEYIIQTILQNISDSQSVSKQLAVKLSQIFNFFVIKTFDKDQTIFKENESCRFIYFILKGQVELTKSFSIQIPKKMIKDENKPHLAKQIEVKVSRISSKCYLGQVQFFLPAKTREFTAVAKQSNTILVQIQPLYFIKLIGQFSLIEKQLMVSAKQKYFLSSENFLKQKNKFVKLFMQEFQNIQNKKKQKILTNLLSQQEGSKSHLIPSNNTTFEIFSKEGMFFRDTYEKLQGFQIYETTQANNKRAAIRKYKVQSNHLGKDNEDKQLQLNQTTKYPSISINRDHDDAFEAFDSKEKLLYSPKKNLNMLDLMGSAPVSPQKGTRSSFISNDGSSKIIRKKKSVGKFQQIQKDEAVFKRVLIKNGRYEQDKTTFKSNIMKPIVHPKFDDIIKQCMSRKNQVIRKAIGQQKNQFIKDSYQNTVESLKNKSLSMSKFSNVSLTCKGTEQFKKKLQFFNKNNRKSELTSGIRSRVAVEQQNLQACIGVNEPPKSSYQKSRTELIESQSKFMKTVSSSNHIGFGQRTSTHFNNASHRSITTGISRRNSPEKLILLNHMMKPMTYSSVQY